MPPFSPWSRPAPRPPPRLPLGAAAVSVVGAKGEQVGSFSHQLIH